MAAFSADDPNAGDKFRKWQAMMGPQQVDQSIRQAITLCWGMMPDEKRTPEAVGVEIRRIVERALANLEEDAKAFGIADDQ